MSKNETILLTSISLLAILLNSSCSQKTRPQIRMNRIPSEILLGDTVTFDWKVTNADTFILSPSGKMLDLSGSLTMVPDSTNSYKFTASGKKGKTSKNYSVLVNPPRLECNIPQVVSDEKPFTFSWVSRFSDYVKVSGIDKIFPTSGTYSMLVDTMTQLTVTSYNKHGKSAGFTQNFKINYEEHFSYQDKIERGDSTTIKWKFKNTKEVYIKGVSRKFSVVDQYTIAPSTSTKFHVGVIRNSGDTLQKTADIAVTQPGFTGVKAPGFIYKGETATIMWSTHKIKDVRISSSEDTLPANGQIMVKPEKTTTYNIFALDGNERISQTYAITINVIERHLVVNSKKYSEEPLRMRFDYEMYATDISTLPDSVSIYVVVVDTMGNFITGLAPPYGSAETSKKYFKSITETTASNKSHKVKSFKVREVHEKNEAPADVNLTLDYSGSMYDFAVKLEKSIYTYIRLMHANSRLSLVRFSDTIIQYFPLSSNPDFIRQRAFLDLKKDSVFFGGTALYAAADVGMASLDSSKNKKKMLLFTDGYENSSFRYFGRLAVFAQQVAKKAKEQGTKINPISYGGETNETVLKFLAVITEGTFYNIINPNDIENVIKENLFLDRNYYVITYKPDLDSGINTISLIYNTNTGKTAIVKRDILIGNKYDLDSLDLKGTSYSSVSKKSWGNLKPISTPQTVANFDFAESVLLKINHKIINPAVTYLKNNPDSKVVIFGHTDLIGSEESCVKLSEERANALKTYLISLGVDEKQIITEPCGKSSPLWKNEDKSWKAAENRRVEILIIQ